MRNKNRLGLLLAIAVIATPIAAFYGTMSSLARYETRRIGLPGNVSNGIQHAYAGAETYWWLRQFGLPTGIAEKTVLRLGYLNEWVEGLIFLRRPDTTRESYKDLQNNFVGIVAIQTIETCRMWSSASQRLALIGKLAENRAVLWRSDDPRVPDLAQPLNVKSAITHFKANRMKIGQAASDDTFKIVGNCRA